MAVSKVVYGGDTLVDLTEDTVTEDALAKGVTAHNAAGNAVTGTFEDAIQHIKVNGTEQEITDQTVDISVPTKVGELENDVPYAAQDDIDTINYNHMTKAYTGISRFGLSTPVTTAEIVNAMLDGGFSPSHYYGAIGSRSSVTDAPGNGAGILHIYTGSSATGSFRGIIEFYNSAASDYVSDYYLGALSADRSTVTWYQVPITDSVNELIDEVRREMLTASYDADAETLALS